MTTPYQQFVARWGGCTACPLHAGRTRVVLARGTVPCALLFVGEAPGRSEDIIGRPFVGPAGRLLDHTIVRALTPWQTPGTAGPGCNTVTYALCNLVCCLPMDEDGRKAVEPPDEAVRACAPRLREFVDLCCPRLLVCVGTTARDWMDHRAQHNVWREDDGRRLATRRLHAGAALPRVDVVHPAAVLRQNIAQQGLSVQRMVVTIRNAVEEHVHVALR